VVLGVKNAMFLCFSPVKSAIFHVIVKYAIFSTV
jgi:hypothetical protein